MICVVICNKKCKLYFLLEEKMMEDIECKIKKQIEELINKGHLDLAEKLIEKVFYIKGLDAEILTMKGIIEIIKRNYEKAEELLTEAIIMEPTYVDAHYNLGYLHYITEELNDACIHYYKALIYSSDMELKKEICDILKKHFKSIINYSQFKEILKSYSSIKKIIFVQDVPCIRTHKIAKVLAKKGIQVDLAYLSVSPEDVYKNIKLPYKQVYQIHDINIFIDFISKSSYDIIYCSNEPDYLTAFLTITNKPVIHDTHDLMSLRSVLSNEQIILEYIANVMADGNIYVHEFVKDIAVNRFNIKHKPIFILNNYIEKSMIPKKFKEKLSNKDNQLHCVFVGGISSQEGHHRFLEPLFKRLIQEGIHVHHYGHVQEEWLNKMSEYSNYFHYEGNVSPQVLIEELTQYDIGLAFFNVNSKNKVFLDTTFANKIFDYLAAGLPIAFVDLLSYRDFNAKFKVGEIINFEQSLREQFYKIKEKKIDRDFLKKNKLLLDDYVHELVYFLSNVKHIAKSKNRPVLVFEENEEFYNKIFIKGGYNNEYHKNYTECIYYPIWEKAVKIIKEIEKNPVVIEIGCGTGQFAKFLFDEGIRNYIGIDFSEEAIKLARINNKGFEDKFVRENAYESDIYWSDYNICVMFEFLEHVKDDISIIKKIRQNTTVLFSVPNFYSISHIRWFDNEYEIRARYKNYLDIAEIFDFEISKGKKIYLVFCKKK